MSVEISEVPIESEPSQVSENTTKNDNDKEEDKQILTKLTILIKIMIQ